MKDELGQEIVKKIVELRAKKLVKRKQWWR